VQVASNSRECKPYATAQVHETTGEI